MTWRSGFGNDWASNPFDAWQNRIRFVLSLIKPCRMNLNHLERQAWQPLARHGLDCPGFESLFGLEVIRIRDKGGQRRTFGNRWRHLAAIDRNSDHTEGGDLNRMLRLEASGFKQISPTSGTW
jgi:hypothetical protein